MRGLLREIERQYPGIGVVVVIDNAPSHCQMENVFREEEFEHHQLVRSAPYSPMLNPIEMVWSVFKSFVKRKLAEHREKLLDREEFLDREGEETLISKRSQYLQMFMTESEDEVTDEFLESLCSRVKVHYTKCIRMEDMEY